MPLLPMDKVKRCQSALWGTRKSMEADLAFYFDARNSTNGKKSLIVGSVLISLSILTKVFL